jgi:hypothetical protein
MPKKSKKSNNCNKSDEEQEQEPQQIYYKKYNKLQATKIEQLTQDFLKNNIINFNSY